VTITGKSSFMAINGLHHFHPRPLAERGGSSQSSKQQLTLTIYPQIGSKLTEAKKKVDPASCQNSLPFFSLSGTLLFLL
jgi:hypothetical protein